MSAFVVSRTHIDYLIESGLRLGVTGRGTLRWLDPAAPVPVWPGSDDPAKTKAYWDASAAQWRELSDATADQVGRMLWAENHRSVSYRYSEAQVCPEYAYSSNLWTRRRLDPVQVLKALNCYEYQSCETSDWQKTEAYAFCERLRSAAIRDLPGYEAADWDIADPEGILA